MTPLLLAAAAICAALAIAAEWNERRHRSFYVLKPLTTLLILAAVAGAPGAGPYQAWLLAALAASLLGDICLMFSGNAWFLAGLGSFLLAHVAFSVAFLQGLAHVALPAWLGAVVLYAAAMLAALLPRAGVLRVPVLFYCAALAAMVFAAAARHAAQPGFATACALAGALLFLLSDSALGWRQFRGRYRFAQPLILATYWGGIGLIAASA